MNDESQDVADDQSQQQQEFTQQNQQIEEEKKEFNRVEPDNSDQNQQQQISVADKLRELGYIILKDETDEYGKLRQDKDNTKGLEWQGQKNYDEIGDLVTDYVQNEMKTTYGLKEVWIPENEDLEPDYHHLPKSNIYMSPDFLDTQQDIEKDALILIQGTGAVRAGVWARSVCLNESLKTGSMLQMIKTAQHNKMSVLVMNPNLRSQPGQNGVIPYCHSMESHSLYVWERYVIPSRFRKFQVIAHSAGGGCLAAIQRKFSKIKKQNQHVLIGDMFYDRCSRVALTDSWVINREQLNKDQMKWMQENAVHFLASTQPLGEEISKFTRSSVCQEKSAGHQKHEYTTGYAYEELVKHFGLQRVD
ncbi:UNKNOWN [Stylonychia lemnae]|uniref:Arb2 domain-containing protein n=1 Tax=Stylonychia lemnae TaxID=5949 RepID=A0A078B8B7_STYLE|nr:UNKNOWN [Stylonychia lemnae]|eukprot:CDW90649.1 UNKNOWN [Stylonychia lemnae]